MHTHSKYGHTYKGLKFIPTPQIDHKASYIKDFLLYTRRLRLKYHFTDRPDDENTNSDSEEENEDSEDEITERAKNLLYESKGWTPLTGQDQNLDAYCNQMENLIFNACCKILR